MNKFVKKSRKILIFSSIFTIGSIITARFFPSTIILALGVGSIMITAFAFIFYEFAKFNEASSQNQNDHQQPTSNSAIIMNHHAPINLGNLTTLTPIARSRDWASNSRNLVNFQQPENVHISDHDNQDVPPSYENSTDSLPPSFDEIYPEKSINKQIILHL